MSTKAIEFWVDLWAGWQDSTTMKPWVRSEPPQPGQNVVTQDGMRRVKIVVELPCIPYEHETVKGIPVE